MSDPDASTDAVHTNNSSKPSRVILSDSELENITISELTTRWRQQDSYITSLEQRLAQQEGRYSIHTLVETLLLTTQPKLYFKFYFINMMTDTGDSRCSQCIGHIYDYLSMPHTSGDMHLINVTSASQLECKAAIRYTYDFFKYFKFLVNR